MTSPVDGAWAVIPVYNEAATVGTVVDRARAAGFLALVVDDGSSDQIGRAHV